MEDSSTEMLGPRGNEETFGFGFNDLDFSDRVLHIEITPVHSNDDSHCPFGVEVKSLHITSLILAAKSPVFYKLFKNGMKESQSKNVTLRINSSEKTSFIDLLKFMYSNTLTAATNPDLLEVLMRADKFEVSSCMKYCVELLLKNPMSVESAVSFLELLSNVLVADAVQPLIDAAYIFLHVLGNSTKAMELPLAAVECILLRGDQRVDSEDVVFDFVLKWAHAHYPKPEECQEIVTNRLMQFICFRNMTYLKLKEALVCPEFKHEEVSKLVIEALFNKAEILSTEHVHVPTNLDSTKDSFVGRIYHDRDVKVAQLELSRPCCVIYFELTKEECKSMSLSNALNSQPFLLGGLWFFLSAQRRKNNILSLFEHFGLFLKIRKGSKTCTVELVIEVMKKSSNKFEGRLTGKNVTLIGDVGIRSSDVLRTPWTTFMSDDSDYFINGILRFRVEISVIKLPNLT